MRGTHRRGGNVYELMIRICQEEQRPRWRTRWDVSLTHNKYTERGHQLTNKDAMRNPMCRCDWFTAERERICLSPYHAWRWQRKSTEECTLWKFIRKEQKKKERWHEESGWISLNDTEEYGIWKNGWRTSVWKTMTILEHQGRGNGTTHITDAFAKSHHTKRTLQRTFWHRNIHNLHIWIRYKQLPVDWRSTQATLNKSFAGSSPHAKNK